MGKPDTEGLSADIPDKTPAKVSSRILNHLLRNAEKIYKCQISDAVITVPANFDSVMCKATRDAAELAGIKVKNEDGSERPVLLSEPNAVIYDLINQIHNGEISNRIIDLTTKKNVLVFDLGGGTLDITMHEIKRRDDFQEVLKVDEIATNRYTLLGGDDFDEAIANEMFLRYIKQYENHPEIVKKLRHEEKRIKPQLRNYAEQLKLELSERCSDDYSSGWDDEEEDMGFPVGGNMGGIGYAYDDSFTKEEIEGILQRFMGENIHYNDYKRIEQITSTRNIMYPILDVLNKASKKLETEDVFIDAVIVNGGMSKFYMITDRLTEFFGFSPIVALDPDQSVARGAAVYHYYLHKYEELKDDMRLLGVSQDLSDEYKEELHSSSLEVEKKKKDKNDYELKWLSEEKGIGRRQIRIQTKDYREHMERIVSYAKENECLEIIFDREKIASPVLCLNGVYLFGVSRIKLDKEWSNIEIFLRQKKGQNQKEYSLQIFLGEEGIKIYKKHEIIYLVCPLGDNKDMENDTDMEFLSTKENLRLGHSIYR